MFTASQHPGKIGTKRKGYGDMKIVTAAALVLASAGLASAGGTYDSTGVIAGQSLAKIYPLAEGHLVMELTGTQDSFDMAADGHPFADLSGTCTGGLEIRGPAATGEGVCTYSNAAGDMAFVRWNANAMTAEGAVAGTWVMIGGTGGMAGMTGGGNYTSKTDRSNGTTRATLTGAVTLP